MCGSPATDVGYISPGVIHKATLSRLNIIIIPITQLIHAHSLAIISLTPGQKYYYIVGDNCSWSEEYSFTAPPSSSNETFVLVTYGGIIYIAIITLLHSCGIRTLL